MNSGRHFFWSLRTPLGKQRFLLDITLLLASIAWFLLCTLLASRPANLALLGWLWIDGGIIALIFAQLCKTRQCKTS